MIRYRITFALYLLNAIGMLAIGLAYQFNDQFMPYHSDVIQTNWNDLQEKQQILYIGMMRTEAAGFLASSTAIIFLLFIPYRNRLLWSTYAIACVGIIEYLPSLIATYHVSTVSEASPPWPVLLLGTFMFLIGLVLSVPVLRKGSSGGT